MGTSAGTRFGVQSLLALAAATALGASALGGTLYWDKNVSTAGATDDAGGVATGTWDNVAANMPWNPSADGTGTGHVAYTSSQNGSEVVFSAGTNATGTYTVTVGSTRVVNSLTFEEGNVTLSGSVLSITSGAATVNPTNTGNVSVASGLTVKISSNVGSASTAFTKLGAGTLELDGANSYAGIYNLQEGTVKIVRSSAGGVGFDNGVFAGTAGTTVQVAGATLDLNGRKESAPTFTLSSGSVVNTDANNTTFDPTAGPQSWITSSTYNLESGTLDVRLTGVGSFTKTTSGTVVMSGKNSFSGTANLNGGRLVVTGYLPATVTNVNDTATLAGSGNGVDNYNYTNSGVIRSVVVNSGGTVDAGTIADTTGLLLMRGNASDGFTLNAGGTFEVDLAGNTAGVGYDRVIVTSPGLVDQTAPDTPVTLAGNLNVDLLGGFTPAAGDLFFILVQQVAATGTGGTIGNVNGTFAGLADGAQFTADGTLFEISYFGDVGTSSFTGGNDVVLRVVPEPASLGLLLVGGLGLIGRRRR